MPKHFPGLTGLTPKQQSFVNDMLAGLTATQSARRAGFAFPSASGPAQMKNPRVLAAIAAEQQKMEKKADMTRKKVIDGLMEAVEMAKAQGDSASMVSAYRELGRLCGYYAAEKKQIDVNVNGAVQVTQIEKMSDEELAKLIEGEAYLVEEDDPTLLPTFPQAEIPEDDDHSLA